MRFVPSFDWIEEGQGGCAFEFHENGGTYERASDPRGTWKEWDNLFKTMSKVYVVGLVVFVALWPSSFWMN